MNNQNVEPATSKSDIVLVTLAVLCAVAGVIAFSLLTSQTLAVRLGALFGGLVAGVVLAWFSRQAPSELRPPVLGRTAPRRLADSQGNAQHDGPRHGLRRSDRDLPFPLRQAD